MKKRFSKKINLLAFLIIFALLGSFTSAFACDQCSSKVRDVYQPNKCSSTTSGKDFNQSFTADHDGWIDVIKVYTDCDKKISYTLYIYSGEGTTGTVLYKESFTKDMRYCNGYFEFAPGLGKVDVKKGSKYTCRIQYTGTNPSSICLHYSNKNEYSGGKYCGKSDQDLKFEVWILPYPTLTCKDVTTYTRSGDYDDYDDYNRHERCSHQEGEYEWNHYDRDGNCSDQRDRHYGDHDYAYKCGAYIHDLDYDYSTDCGIKSITYKIGSTVHNSNDASGWYDVGITNIVWTLTDIKGKTQTCTTKVTVIDNQKPIIDCPEDITVNNDAGKCGAVVTFEVKARDNCSGVTVVSVPASGYEFPVGTTTVNSTATDASGNKKYCSFTVTVIDKEAPVPPKDDGTTVACVSAAVDVLPTATDNCDGVVQGKLIKTEDTPDPLTCEGTRILKYSYTDNALNVSYSTFTYTIDYSGGLTAPELGDATVSCPGESQIAPLVPDITDACNRTVSGVYVSNDPEPDCNGNVVWNYTYTACDGTTSVPWTFTYHVIYSGGLTAPDLGEATVSCPEESQNKPFVPDILDACNRTVSGVYVSNDDEPDCNGNVVWNYTYTACDGITSVPWTFTYHVIYTGGLTAPDLGDATVSCPGESQIAPLVPDITDACNRTVSGVYVSNDPEPDCNGDVVWNYTYTACDGTTSVPWTFTYHVIYSGGLTAPDLGEATVSCPEESQNEPFVPDILDACNRTVSGVYVSNDDEPDCNGNVVWNYTYTACDGITSVPWTFTYHVIYTGGLTAPDLGDATVSCPGESQIAPLVPDITDACNRTVSGVYVSNDPEPDCNGDVVWNYTYTACDGITSVPWTFTYHVIYTGGLTAPDLGDATVSCPGESQIAPLVPDITDACNRTVSGVYVSNDPEPDCNGNVVWNYTYTACDGITSVPWTFTYHVIYSGGLTAPDAVEATVSCPDLATDPGAPADITDACGRTVSAVFVPSSIVPSDCNGDIVYTYRYTACDGITTADWTYTYHVIYTGGLTAPDLGDATVSCPGESQIAPLVPDITDACNRTVSGVYVSNDDEPDCNGNVVWNYTYTACDGITSVPWTFTYHVIYSGGLTAPDAVEATVSCPDLATDPGAPADITDACGRTVSAVLVGSESTPATLTCNGQVVWTYRYTACDDITTADWTYTYDVTYSDGLNVPELGATTVFCPGDAVDPGTPDDITDACGRTVVAVLVGSESTPNPIICEGTVVWAYRYTACDDITTADWTYTYTVGKNTTPPTIACPGGITTYEDSPNTGYATIAKEDLGEPLASDFCLVKPKLTNNAPVDNHYLVGITTVVTWTATDACGNTATCEQNVTVLPYNSTPCLAFANCQNIEITLDETGNASITADNVDNGSGANNCTFDLTIDKSDFTCADVGKNTVVLTVESSSGSIATCEATVTVKPSKPVAICQNIEVTLDKYGCYTLTAKEIDGGSSDACGKVELSIPKTKLSCSDVGHPRSVTLTATYAGIKSTCTAIVTVKPPLPIAQCKHGDCHKDYIEITLDDDGHYTLKPCEVDDRSYDLCGGKVTLSVSPNTFGCDDVGKTIDVILTVTSSGGQAQCTTKVKVNYDDEGWVKIVLDDKDGKKIYHDEGFCAQWREKGESEWHSFRDYSSHGGSHGDYEGQFGHHDRGNGSCDGHGESSDEHFKRECGKEYEFRVDHDGRNDGYGDGDRHHHYSDCQSGIPSHDNCKEFIFHWGSWHSKQGDQDVSTSNAFEISQNNPNPFDVSTTISCNIPIAGNVTLTIYNSFGDKVMSLINNYTAAGNYDIVWKGTDSNGMPVPNGVYYATFTSGTFSKTIEMTYIK